MMESRAKPNDPRAELVRCVADLEELEAIAIVQVIPGLRGFYGFIHKKPDNTQIKLHNKV